MKPIAYSTFSSLYHEGQQASLVRARKSPSGVPDLLEVARPGNMARPALLHFVVLYQDMLGGSRVRGDLGGGHFDVIGKNRRAVRDRVRPSISHYAAAALEGRQ